MSPEVQKTYQVQPEGFWSDLQSFSSTGYNAMAFADQYTQWEAIGSWGKVCCNLGYWPYVIIFFRDRENAYDVLEYCEGDVTQWSCPTPAIREEITNELAFKHWKLNTYSAPTNIDQYNSVNDLPDDMKGPFLG